MRPKTNLVISAIFLALLAFVYFYEIRGGEQRRAEAERAKQLVDFGDHEVSRLVVDGGDSVVVVEKSQDGWVVRLPVETDADADAVKRYLRNLRETEMERLIEDSAAVAQEPALLARYGLEAPRLRVLVELADGPLDSIYLGADSPTERYTYGQRSGANPQVFAVRAWRFDNLDKGLFDLRDRRVLAFERDEIRQIRLVRSWEEEPVVLVREGGGEWELAEPLAAAADQAAVNGVVNRLANGKAERFAVERPGEEELAEHGLTPGAALIQVSLLLGEDRAEKRLTIGYEEAHGGHFALDASRPPIFVVDSTVVGQLRKALSDLRDRRPLRLNRDAVVRVTLSRPGQADLVAERDTADTSTWRVVAPEKRESRSWRLNSLLTDLDDVEVKAFVSDGDSAAATSAAYGLAEPRLTIAADPGEGPPVIARFGKEAEGAVYLGHGSSVYQVAASTLDNLDLTLDDVAQPAPEPAADTAGNDTTPGEAE